MGYFRQLLFVIAESHLFSPPDSAKADSDVFSLKYNESFFSLGRFEFQ
jgi:hypothetical protein